MRHYDMKQEVFLYMTAHEQSHWWFSNQQKAARLLLEKHLRKRHAMTLLDAGCGTGRCFELLSSFGTVFGIEKNPDWCRYCIKEKAYEDVMCTSVENRTYGSQMFDAIVCLEVLEHTEHDTHVIRNFAWMLKEKGMLVLSVPCGATFFSGTERKLYGHYRRYNPGALKRKLEENFFTVIDYAYFNLLTLLPIVVIRKTADLFGLPVKNEVNTGKSLNTLLRCLLRLELPLFRLRLLPFGLSLFVVARKSKEGKCRN